MVLEIKIEKPFQVQYRGQNIRIYVADIVVNNKVIVELKSVDRLHQNHRAQTLNYLKVGGLPIGFLINFGASSLEIKRVIL